MVVAAQINSHERSVHSSMFPVTFSVGELEEQLGQDGRDRNAVGRVVRNVMNDTLVTHPHALILKHFEVVTTGKNVYSLLGKYLYTGPCCVSGARKHMNQPKSQPVARHCCQFAQINFHIHTPMLQNAALKGTGLNINSFLGFRS